MRSEAVVRSAIQVYKAGSWRCQHWKRWLRKTGKVSLIAKGIKPERQQISESESLSSCMTEVLAWYIELFSGSVNVAGTNTISELQTFYLTLSLPFLLQLFNPIFPPVCLITLVGLAMVWLSLVNYNLWSWLLFWNTFSPIFPFFHLIPPSFPSFFSIFCFLVAF